MTERQLTFSFILDDKFSGQADQISRKVGGLRDKFAKFNAELAQQGVTLQSVADKLGNWASKMKWVSGGIIAASGAAIIAASNYEKLGIQLEVLTGDATKGQALLKALRDFALSSATTGADEINYAATSLLSYGYAAEDVMKNLEMMNTVAVATNVPLTTIADSLGRMKSEGRVNAFGLRAIRLTRFQPMLEALYSGQMGPKEFKKALGAGRIPFSAIEKVLADRAVMLGPIAARLDATTGEKLGDTKTLLGQITVEYGKLIDQQANANTLTSAFNDRLKGIRDNLGSFAAAHPGLTKFVLALGVALVIATPLLVVMAGFLSMLAFIGTIAAATGIAFGVLVGWIFGGFILIVGAILLVIKYWDKLVALWKGTTNWFLESGFGGALKMMGVIDATSTNKAQVDINVGTKGGATANATAKSLSPSLDIGLNMWPNMSPLAR